MLQEYNKNTKRFLSYFTQSFGFRKVRALSLGGENPTTPSNILPQFFHPVTHFQWKGPNTAVTRLVDRL